MRKRTVLAVSVSVSVSVSAATAAAAGLAAVASPPAAAATTLIVATSGSDTAPGTIDRPLKTIQKAVDLAQPGDVIAIRGGTYAPTTNIKILKSGQPGRLITMTNYSGERVVIDGEQLPNTPAPLGGSIPRGDRGTIHQEASYWRIAGLEIVNGPYAIYCSGCDHNVFERLATHDNYESGFQLQDASSDNLILNLDSYANRDPRKNGESADGLAIKEGSGSGNIVRGARLWNNVDDGFDAFEFLSPILIENSVAYGNGFNRWDFPDFQGDGNGFKMGGGDPDPPADHVVRNSMAFDNSTGGFIDNGNPGSITMDHDTAYRNAETGFDAADSRSTLTKNLAVGNGTAVSLGSATANGNSWDIGGTWNDSSLVSADPSVLTGSRTAGGDIARSDFLRPRGGADVGARI
jgi:hypothetical protein